MFNDFRLMFNLFGGPGGLLIGAFLASGFASQTKTSIALAPLTALASWATAGALIVAGLWTLYSISRLWGVLYGNDERCHVCAMPVRLIDPGRYSPHYRCMRCGLNRLAYL